MQTLGIRLFILGTSFVILIASGCDQVRRDWYTKAHADLPAEIAKNIKNGYVIPGMTKQEVTAAMGKPRIVDYEESVEIWKYEAPAIEGVWIRSIRFAEGQVLSIKSDLVPIEIGRAWDKFTPRDVRIKD